MARFSEKVTATWAGQFEGVDVLDVDVLVAVLVVVEALEEVVVDDDDGGVVPEPLMAMSAHPR